MRASQFLPAARGVLLGRRCRQYPDEPGSGHGGKAEPPESRILQSGPSRWRAAVVSNPLNDMPFLARWKLWASA